MIIATIGFWLTLIVALGCTGYLLFLMMRRSEAPGKFAGKMVFTVVFLTGAYFLFEKLMGKHPYLAAFAGGAAVAIIGVTLAILWRHGLADAVAKPFENLFTGGGDAVDPEPMFSIAQSRRQQQHYVEAVREVERQLERFPNSVEAHLLIAEIYADDLKDLPAARNWVDRACVLPDATPQQVAFALNSMADWELKLGHDPEAARRCLENIRHRFPNRPCAATAAQRIARLPTREMLDETSARRVIHYTPKPKDRLYKPVTFDDLKTAPSAEEQAEALIQQLALHPGDLMAREELALVYARDLGEVDKAREQVERLLQSEGAPHKRVIHWLILLADINVKYAGDEAAAAAALDRIIKRFPKLPAAQQALERKMTLGRELRGQQKTSRVVKLGSYERDVGLKGGTRLT